MIIALLGLRTAPLGLGTVLLGLGLGLDHIDYSYVQQMSFFPKTIWDWNKLPHRIIESESLNEFSNYFH